MNRKTVSILTLALLAACSHAQRAVDHLNQAARWGLAPSDEAMQEAS